MWVEAVTPPRKLRARHDSLRLRRSCGSVRAAPGATEAERERRAATEVNAVNHSLM